MHALASLILHKHLQALKPIVEKVREMSKDIGWYSLQMTEYDYVFLVFLCRR